MATELLSIGTNTTPSDEFTVMDGEQLTVVLKGSSDDGTLPNAQVYLQVKDDDSNFWNVEILNSRNNGIIISGAGTYRLLRKEGGKPVGAFSA